MVGIAVWRRRRLGEWLMWWKGEGGGQREGGSVWKVRLSDCGWIAGVERDIRESF